MSRICLIDWYLMPTLAVFQYIVGICLKITGRIW